MKVFEVKKESVSVFINDYVGIQNCPISALDSFLIKKDKLDSDIIQFILDEYTNITNTELETLISFKKETYDSIHNKYIKQR